MYDFLNTVIAAKYNFWIYIALMMIGLYAMIGKKNLIKKIIGMNIFQTAIILFYVSIGVKKGATLPIIEHGPGHAAEAGEHAAEIGGQAAELGHQAVELGHQAADLGPQAADAGHGLAEAGHAAVHAIDYINPLPHVLMLTAIVVSVATLGVALALALKIYKEHNTLSEDEILEDLRKC